MFISMWAQDKNGLIGKNGLLPCDCQMICVSFANIQWIEF